MSFKAVNEIWRARQRAAQRAQEDLSQGAHGRHGYDPNQPRVPAGHPDGGQWTSGEHDPAGTARVTVNPDGSMVRSEVNVSDPSIPWDEHHTVRLPNGHEFTFEDFGPTQTVYDGEGVPVTQTVLTSDGPEPQAIVQPAFWRGAVRQGVRRIPQGGVVAESTEAALALFTALSASNSRNSTAALDFRAEDYRRGANAPNMAIRVERLTEEEVNDLCRRYDKTKKALDEAVDKAAEEPYRNAAIFGTRVHKILGDKIKGENEENWRSEVSLEKIIQEDP